MSRIVSACCRAKLRWRKRRPGEIRTVRMLDGRGVKVKIPGPVLHAYVCDDCGKPDR